MIVDLIASGAGPNEVREAINTGLFEASVECIDTYKEVVGDRFFDEAADVVTKGAKKAMPMEKAKGKMPKGYEQSAEAKRQNNSLLATGENAAGGVEPAAYYKGRKKSAQGWMNPLGEPERAFGGDTRPNKAGGADLPFYDGTVT